MLINPNTYYIFVAIIVMLTALLTGVTLSYFISSKRLLRLEKKQNEIITAAQTEAERIIGEATQINYSSQNKLNQAADKLTEDETRELAQKSEEFTKLFDEKIDRLNNDNIQMFKKASEDINQTVSLHFEQLKSLLSEQTVQSQKIAEDKIKSEYAKLEQELEEYKKSQLQKINDNIYQILLSVSQDVFGKKLDTREHEEMISKALTEAEKSLIVK